MHHRTTPSLAVVNQVISHMARPSLAGFRSTNNLAITQEMIRRLDLGQDMAKLKFVHIAGTKGKGSTSFATAKLLQRAGLRVGLFTSPHLVDVRERCLINGEMLDKNIFSKAFLEFQETHDRAFEKEEWAPEGQGGTLPQKTSFFRFMFLFAIRMFAEQAVDVVVLEVGVGGRLDSTNAVTPVVCGITALGMDHMDILGNTIESIAFEKAGIAKRGVPLFTSCQRDYPQTLDVISKQAAEVKAPMTIIQDNWYETVDWSSVRQRGDHMVENCKLAVALSRTALGRDVHEAVTKEELEVLANSAYPGRSHVVPHPVGRAKFYLDGAHTPESMRVAAKWFFEAAARDGLLTPGRPRAVLLFFSSRDNRKLLSAFVPYAQHIHKIVFVTFPHDSSQLPNTGTEHLYKAQEAWRSLVAEHQSTHPQLADVQAVVKEEPLTSVTHLADVVDEGAASNDLVPTLCTGSLYLIGAVLQTLQSTPS